MADITNDAYGGASILLSDGLQVRLPGLNPAGREPNIQDIKNLATALLVLVKNLDDRLEKLEKKET
jgi:CII-binding regulator of phage lambda lysogenization HflD